MKFVVLVDNFQNRVCELNLKFGKTDSNCSGLFKQYQVMRKLD